MQVAKLQIDNNHLVAKAIGVDKAIKKVESPQQEYNELDQVHFKRCNDLKSLQANYDQLMRDYRKMKVVSIQ